MFAAAAKRVVDLGMRGQESLRLPRGFIPAHLPLPGRLVGNLRPVIQSLVLPMFDTGQDFRLGRSVAFELVRHQDTWNVTQALEQFGEKPPGRLLVAPALHQHIQRVPLLIDRPPQVMVLALDRQHDLVQMPFVSTPGLAPTQHVRVGLAEFQRPLSDRLVRHENPAAGHQLFDVAKAQAETEI